MNRFNPIALAVALLGTSCQLATHESHASATKWEKDTNISWGGTTHTTGADGWDNATDHNASFQVAMQTGGAALAGWLAAAVSKAEELTKQIASNNLTKQQLATTQANLQLQLAQIAAATKQLEITTGAAAP